MWKLGGGNFLKSLRGTGCRGAVRIGFVRNDILDTNTQVATQSEKCFAPHGTTQCEPWATAELLGSFDVIVVNSGAHFVEDGRYKKLMSEAANAISTVARKDSLVIFRSTVPGHQGCNDALAPFDSISEAEHDTQAQPWYEGDRFAGHNIIAKEIFERAGFVYMDVYTSTILRRDMHVGGNDCLHYCLPGPSMSWVDILIHGVIGGNNMLHS